MSHLTLILEEHMDNAILDMDDFDLDLDMEIMDSAVVSAQSKTMTGTGTCISCPVTSWHC
ncbi:hypothetical protein AB0B79_06950 [Streptomyces sp. NPDC039022]|uniref:hypothetical protein n=1 Tax=unclassified Streptomyces TaxID=2593676 RepID=UPI0033F9F836